MSCQTIDRLRSSSSRRRQTSGLPRIPTRIVGASELLASPATCGNKTQVRRSKRVDHHSQTSSCMRSAKSRVHLLALRPRIGAPLFLVHHCFPMSVAISPASLFTLPLPSGCKRELRKIKMRSFCGSIHRTVPVKPPCPNAAADNSFPRLLE